MPRLNKEQTEFKVLIEAAFSGDNPEFAQVIQDAGYVDPRNGVKQKEVCDVIPRKTLLVWEKDGLEFVKVGRSKYYPFVELVRFMHERASKSKMMESDKQKQWGDIDAEYKAKDRMLKYEVEAGNYLAVDDVKRTWCEHIASCRKRLLAMPRALAGRIQGETKRSVIEREVKEEIYSALEELK